MKRKSEIEKLQEAKELIEKALKLLDKCPNSNAMYVELLHSPHELELEIDDRVLAHEMKSFK